MRYYDIKITGGQQSSTDAGSSNNAASKQAGTGGRTIAHWTTHPSGRSGRADPGALQIDIDVSIQAQDTPVTSNLRIYGLPLKTIADTKSLFDATIEVSAGFGPGLPLATLASKAAGPILKGKIYQAFGTWEGTDTRLDLVVVASTTTPSPAGGPNPPRVTKNLTIDWKKDTPLAKPLEATLRQAFPDMKIVMDISSKIVARQNQPGFFSGMSQLALYARRISQDILGGGAVGVSIVDQLGELRVSDGTSSGSKKKVDPNMLIGQPTWFEPNKVFFKTVMRADIKVLDQVELPKTFFNSSMSAATKDSNAATGQLGISGGTFTIEAIRHIGASRAPSADAWVTVFTAYIVDAAKPGFTTPAFPLPGSVDSVLAWPFSIGGP